MGKRKPISKEDLIAQIEARLNDSNLSGREFTSLSKRLSNLRGWVKQGEYVRTAHPQPEQQEPGPLPTWWTDSWARIFIAERASGSSGHSIGRWTRELDQFEAEWAKREGLTVPELREALRREDAEYKAHHSNEERLAMARASLYEQHPDRIGGQPEENK